LFRIAKRVPLERQQTFVLAGILLAGLANAARRGPTVIYGEEMKHLRLNAVAALFAAPLVMAPLAARAAADTCRARR
jgi:hypothetical protein